jgi:exopolysaccharide biosynthesis protein
MAAKKKAAKKKTVRRTTLRSSKGTKLYAVRAADGTFKDIQTFKRAHSADIRKSSTAEATKKAAKKKASAKKAPARKKAAAKKK